MEKQNVMETNDLGELNLDLDRMVKACKGTVYAYARVSTDAQDCQRQYDAFHRMGFEKKQIFTDKMSGKDFERPAYQRLMKKVRPGDLIVFKSLDRFGRSVKEINRELYELTVERGVGIAFIDSPVLNRVNEQSTMAYTISSIMYLMYSYSAESERKLILQRTAEGRRIAKEKGVRFGRPPKEIPPRFWDLKYDLLRGDMSYRSASRELGVNFRTLKRWIRCARKQEIMQALEQKMQKLIEKANGCVIRDDIKDIEAYRMLFREIESLLDAMRRETERIAHTTERRMSSTQEKESVLDIEIDRLAETVWQLNSSADKVVRVINRM